MSNKIIVDANSSNVTIVRNESDKFIISLEELKQQKLEILINIYKECILQGFVSSATGIEVIYGYNQQDQLNYSKWANVFALNPNKEYVIIGSESHGVVTMNREQFIKFIDDAENHEVNMYLKRKSLEKQIDGASSIEELATISIEF